MNSGLESSNLVIELRLVILSNLHSNHLQMTKCYPCSKEGQHTYPNQLTNLETIILWIFWKFCNLWQWCQNCTPSTWIYCHPPTHVQLKILNNKCLGYVAVECHTNFQINWESFAHRDQLKNMVSICCP